MDHATNIDAGFPGVQRTSLLPLGIYLTVLFACFSVVIGYYLFDPFGFENPKRDSWHHIAVLGELITNPLDPSNPHIPTDEPSRYYSPLAVLAGFFGQIFSLTSWQVYGIVSTLTCLGLAASCWLFAKKYYRSAWAPLLLLVSLLFAWGEGKGHAGFHNFSTFVSSAAYPTSQALVLGIFSWYLALRAAEHRRLLSSAAFGLMATIAIMVLTHQFSGVIMAAGAGSFILFHSSAGWKHKIQLLSAMAFAGLATLLWPYFNPLDVVLSASDPRWKSDVTDTHKLSYMLMMIAPALAGILGFKHRDTGAIRWEIAVPTAFFAGFFALSYLSGMSIAHRVPPAVLLYLQLGLVWLFLTVGPQLKKAPALTTIIGLICASLILANFWTAARPRLKEFHKREQYGRMIDSVKSMAAHVDSNSIAFATHSIVYPYQATGRRVVSIPRPEPVAPSLPERQAATDRFFDEDTSQAERQSLISDWAASHIVFSAEDLPSSVVQNLRSFGPSEQFPHDVEIITIDKQGKSL